MLGSMCIYFASSSLGKKINRFGSMRKIAERREKVQGPEFRVQYEKQGAGGDTVGR